MLINLLLLIAGIVLLVKGADWFVEGASGIAQRLGIPELVIGLTIVAMGTSMPEAAVSIAAALKGNAGISIGNVVGSNIINILIILGITAIITRVAIQKSTLLIELPFMLLISAALLLFGLSGNALTFSEGIVFWVLFILYLTYLFFLTKRGEHPEPSPMKGEPAAMPQRKGGSMIKYLILITVGGAMVVFGSDIAVEGATGIARVFGMSERFIGLTIVALGTSLPELVTSVTAARKGNAGIAIGNIVGSNIFNILFVLGTTALICDVPFQPVFRIDCLIAIGAGVLLWLGTIKRKELRRPCGCIMLAGYVVYFCYLTGMFA